MRIDKHTLDVCCKIVGKDCPFCRGTGISEYPNVPNCGCPAFDLRNHLHPEPLGEEAVIRRSLDQVLDYCRCTSQRIQVEGEFWRCKSGQSWDAIASSDVAFAVAKHAAKIRTEEKIDTTKANIVRALKDIAELMEVSNGS